jgi:drug/metabolite transporter (DMT)-like permease
MQMLSHLMLVAALVCTLYSQLVIKSRALVHAPADEDRSNYLQYLVTMFTDWRVLTAVLATFSAGVLWMLAIKRLDVGYAFPFMALSFVLVPVGSHLWLSEPLPASQLAGLGLIVAGVTVSAVAR